jgi:hypothetical protein
MHSTKKKKRKSDYADRPPHNAALETVDAVLDRGLTVDGFRRVSFLGLEVLTLDGPTRVRRAVPQPDESK